MADKYPVNLPQTPFPMRADLPGREPGFFDFWKKIGLKEKLQAARKGRAKFVLHDGPPYANGPIHIGHALNKILKDFILRYKIMAGFESTYIPGWDCHGLPIEQALLKELKISKKEAFADPVGFRKKCREFVLKMVDLQRKDFMRLGIEGEWEKPYITQELPYAGKIVEAFIELYKKGYIYKGKKPVFWCIYCETALAQAEIEYAQKTSPSIYVKFPSADSKNTFALVWTTTPWTLPGNRALALNPALEYVMAQVDDPSTSLRAAEPEQWILAKARVEAVLDKELGLAGKYKVLKTLTGKELKDRSWFHPLYPDSRRPTIAHEEMVSAEDGTGIVHTAPGHGDVDYKIGHGQFKLEVASPVDSQGRFTQDAGRSELEGIGIKENEANKKVCELLNSHLAHQASIQHSYPHCWRCKNPVIFRATDQWFMEMEHKEGGKTLRQRILNQLEPSQTQWFPEGSVERIKSMVEGRPDWCLSRQRLWGSPIPVLYCKGCGAERTKEEPGLFDEILAKIYKEGEDFWFDPKAEFLKPWGEKYPCTQCKSTELIKDNNILDVWLDSGVSWFAVVQNDSRLAYPADLYLEGSDQHRGWFQTSLITAVALTGRAPYRHVFTNGWVLDDQGRAMHKSLGNVVSPQEIINTLGADILRLWAAESGGMADARISKNSMGLYTEHYKKIRNTLRYLMGALSDFKPGRDGVRFYEDLGPLERWALGNLAEMAQRCREGYEAYDFPRVTRSILDFCIHDLSNFYLDISKDRLYTFKADDPLRRGTQTVLWVTLHHLLACLAPVMPFTAEEAWQEMLKLLDMKDARMLANVKLEFPESVHLASFPLACADWKNKEIAADSGPLLALREKAHRQMDALRKDKILGSSLEARVKLEAPKKEFETLRRWQAYLPTILIVSDVELAQAAGEDGETRVAVEKAPGNKCVRCWVVHPGVGESSEHPDLCAKCIQVLFS